MTKVLGQTQQLELAEAIIMGNLSETQTLDVLRHSECLKEALELKFVMYMSRRHQGQQPEYERFFAQEIQHRKRV